MEVDQNTAFEPREHIEDNKVDVACDLDRVCGVDEQDVVRLQLLKGLERDVNGRDWGKAGRLGHTQCQRSGFGVRVERLVLGAHSVLGRLGCPSVHPAPR